MHVFGRGFGVPLPQGHFTKMQFHIAWTNIITLSVNEELVKQQIKNIHKTKKIC